MPTVRDIILKESGNDCMIFKFICMPLLQMSISTPKKINVTIWYSRLCLQLHRSNVSYSFPTRFAHTEDLGPLLHKGPLFHKDKDQ